MKTFYTLIALLAPHFLCAVTGYVTNTGSNTVSIFNTNTNAITGTITVGSAPQGITFVGRYGYVTNSSSNTVSIIDSANNTTVGSAIAVDSTPNFAASYGSYVYVTNYRGGNGYGSISVIDSTLNTVVTTITDSTFNGPTSIAFVNHYGYITNWGSQYAQGTGNTISILDTTTNKIVGVITLDPVAAGAPEGIITNGMYAYTANGFSPGSVSVINTLTNRVVTTISSSLFNYPQAITVMNGKAFITNNGSNTVSVINLATNTLQTTFTVSGTSGSAPAGITPFAINNAFRGYVANYTSSSLSVIDPYNFTYTSISDSSVTLNNPSFIAFPYPVNSPTNLNGSQQKNSFGTLHEYFNTLAWTQGSGSNISGYRIYRNDVLIATVGSSITSYEDHNRDPSQADNYVIYAFDSNGNLSIPQFVQVIGM